MGKQIKHENLSEIAGNPQPRSPGRGQQIIWQQVGPTQIPFLVPTAVALAISPGQQQWAAEKRRLARVACHAIQGYLQNPDQHHQRAALDAVESCSLCESSEHRLLTVLRLIKFAPPEIFWPAFMDEWSDCDATWGDRARVLRALKNQEKPALPFFSQSQRKFFETLPPLVRVFRGCSAPRVRGISWTVDHALAEEFARGHRGRVPEPVVASALIPKEHIFFVTDEREEKEIVLNPRRLRKVFIEPFEGV